MKKIIALLENVRSLHNVGSVFRNADGAGVDQVILGGYTGIPPRKEIAKVSLGAEDFVDWEQAVDVRAKILELKENGYLIVASEITPESQNIHETEFPDRDICLVFGNEVEGVMPETLDLCDLVCHVPMAGIKASLNISVCTGIVFYEFLRRKN